MCKGLYYFIGQSILLIILILYFIRQQFNFNLVTKVTYFFLPVISLYPFLMSFNFSKRNLIALFIIMISSLLIGYFQSKKSIVRMDSEPVYYFYNHTGQEVTIYKKIVKVKGGSFYLIGWIAIFVIQMIMQVMITSQGLSSSEIVKNFGQSVLDDTLEIYRLFDLKDNKGSWYTWALYGLSSLSYTYFLSRKSDMVSKRIFESKRKYDYNLEEYMSNKG